MPAHTKLVLQEKNLEFPCRFSVTQFSSVQFSCSVMSDSVTPWIAACQASLSITNSRSSLRFMSHQWCHPAISSSVVRFSCPQSLPPSKSFPMSQLFTCQHPLDHGKSKRVPEKHLFLLYWLCQSLWLCGSQENVGNSERDGNTRPPNLPLEKSVCRSGSNS